MTKIDKTYDFQENYTLVQCTQGETEDLSRKIIIKEMD